MLPDEQIIQGLLTFWFAEETKERWYDSTPVFDQLCCDRFGAMVEKAGKNELSAWEQTAEGALALCLLLDQIPRNIFRGTPRAFETDPKAVEVAKSAIEKGFDQELDVERRKFLYLPFMHSEVLAEQERSVALSLQIGDEKTQAYAEDHADIIRRFGRFPHRNTILGRESTEEELAFLQGGAKDYGQSAKST
jgi:uncharacterized protein (DUF924 family)